MKSSGGDYSSLSAWEAAKQADIVSADQIQQAECYDMADPGNVDIVGWTTGAANYIRIFPATGQGHVGVWSTSKFRVVSASSGVYGIYVGEEYVRIEGVQFDMSDRSAIWADPAGTSDVRLHSLLIRGSGLTGSDAIGNIRISQGTIDVRNSIIYASNSTGIGVGGGTVTVDNCTIAANTTYGINRSAGTVTIRNVYSGGNGTDDYNGTIGKTTCAHSSATVFTGSTASIAHDTNNFISVTGGSEDYHLEAAASATLLTGGTDLSGTFTTDIDGDTRVDWSIGADEVLAAPGGFTSRLALMGVGCFVAIINCGAAPHLCNVLRDRDLWPTM